MTNLIELKNISKYYSLYYKEPLLTTAILRNIKRARKEIIRALEDISLEVKRGESIGIIGENGAGKSTLLKILTAVTTPTTGVITINGRIGSLLELGTGFHPYLTGRENIFLCGAILGMKRQRIKELFNEITDFADIGKFIDAPVSVYSNGMYLRLGFSVAVHMDADILVVDEVLAVGDEEFQTRCLSKIGELTKEGKSLVIVSHDLNLIRSVCQKTGWLTSGHLQSFGNPLQVTSLYLLDVSRRQGMAIIDNFPLTLVFQKGKLLLFWHGIELTKNLCGYTSIFSLGSWQDSTQAQWEVEKKGNKLTATGKWFKIPVIQTWEIETAGNTIVWQMVLIVTTPFRIDHETINLMLSESFTSWQTNLSDGEFPHEFKEGFWSRSVSITKDKPFVMVKPQDSSLPKVNFELNNTQNDYIGVIANTDSVYRARVIQYERKKMSAEYLPEERYSFSGTIRIG